MQQTILVTGGSRGIGRFLCGYFVTRGAHVVAAARNIAAVNLPENCTPLPLDLSDRASIADFAIRLRAAVPKLDVLINNAADTTSKPLLETSPEEIERLVGTNITGLLQLCRELTPWMIETGGGSIVNISSLAGYKANPSQTVYCITKSAVNGASDALRAELAPHGIHVMNVALPSIAVDGAVRRDQVPIEKFAARLVCAIAKRETELFLSPVTKWLMRLYRFCPPLSRLRR